MLFPRIDVKIQRTFPTITPPPDRVCGIIATGSEVVVGSDTIFEIGENHRVVSLDHLEDTFGVTEDNNPTIYKMAKDFWSVTGGDALLYIRPTALDTLDDICDTASTNGAKDFINSLNGELNIIAIGRSYPDGYGIDGNANYAAPVNDIDVDFRTATDKLQIVLAEAEGNQKFCVALLPCVYVDPTSLDADNSPKNQTNFLVSSIAASDGYDSAKGVNTSVIGAILGRNYATGVSQNIGDRSLFGSLLGVTNYFLGRGIESDGQDDNAKNIVNAGFVGLYKLSGDGGFYVSSGVTSDNPDSSRDTIAANRTLHKGAEAGARAVRQYLNGNYSVTPTGALDPSIVSAIEADGQNALQTAIQDDADSFSFTVTDVSTFQATGSITCQILIQPKNTLNAIAINVRLSRNI